MTELLHLVCHNVLHCCSILRRNVGTSWCSWVGWMRSPPSWRKPRPMPSNPGGGLYFLCTVHCPLRSRIGYAYVYQSHMTVTWKYMTYVPMYKLFLWLSYGFQVVTWPPLSCSLDVLTSHNSCTTYKTFQAALFSVFTTKLICGMECGVVALEWGHCPGRPPCVLVLQSGNHRCCNWLPVLAGVWCCSRWCSQVHHLHQHSRDLRHHWWGSICGGLRKGEGESVWAREQCGGLM